MCSNDIGPTYVNSFILHLKTAIAARYTAVWVGGAAASLRPTAQSERKFITTGSARKRPRRATSLVS